MSKWRNAQWVFIFGILFAFTFVTVGGASLTFAEGYNGFIQGNISHLSRGNMIYFADSQGYFGRQQFVCSITPTQLSDIESSYSVTTKTYTVKHHTYTVVTVSTNKGKGAKGIEQIVGKRLANDCKVQSTHSFLYLFTVPELS